MTQTTDEIHEYPGEVKERPGGPIPLFLKLTYVGFTAFGVVYFFLYRAGDGAPLVKALNAVTGHGAP
ncbi:MAG TPA: hypothetical protein VH880_00550 [Anaeromyxobacteraceae bacterium]|jgi:hypothetical protein